MTTDTNTTIPADNTITREARERQRALDALASLDLAELLAIGDALDMAIKNDAAAVATANSRAEKAGRRRHSDGSYSGEHSSTTDRRDRMPHMQHAREIMTTAIVATHVADNAKPGGVWHNR